MSALTSPGAVGQIDALSYSEVDSEDVRNEIFSLAA